MLHCGNRRSRRASLLGSSQSAPTGRENGGKKKGKRKWRGEISAKELAQGDERKETLFKNKSCGV